MVGGVEEKVAEAGQHNSVLLAPVCAEAFASWLIIGFVREMLHRSLRCVQLERSILSGQLWTRQTLLLPFSHIMKQDGQM
jgi:hypothetical protein